MAVDIAVVGTCIAMLLGASQLLAPILKIHSRMDVLDARLKAIEDYLRGDGYGYKYPWRAPGRDEGE